MTNTTQIAPATTQEKSFVSFTFTGTTHLTPEEIRSYFNHRTIATDNLTLNSDIGNMEISMNGEFHLEDVELIEEEE